MDIDVRKAHEVFCRLWVRHIALLFSVWCFTFSVLYFLFQEWPFVPVILAAACAPFVFGNKNDMDALVRELRLRKFGRLEKEFVEPFFAETKLPVPELYTIRNPHIFNAFAFYLNGKRSVAVSPEMFRFGRNKFFGILAHEIAHFENGDLYLGPVLLYGYLLGGIGIILLGIILAAQSFSYAIIIGTLALFILFHFFTQKLFYYWYAIGQEARCDVLGVIFTKDVTGYLEALLYLTMEKRTDGEGRLVMLERIRILASVKRGAS